MGSGPKTTSSKIIMPTPSRKRATAAAETTAKILMLVFFKPSSFKPAPLYLANNRVIPKMIVSVTGEDISATGKDRSRSSAPMPINISMSPTMIDPTKIPPTKAK